MNLQTSILKKYTRAYPNETLRDTACRTGIQKTRAFRLFNGAEMKLSEYQLFASAINNKDEDSYYVSQSEFLTTAKECFCELSAERLEQLLVKMKHNLKLKQFNSSTNPFKQAQGFLA